MAPQLTLQAPLELPPHEVPNYLSRLWEEEHEQANGASTFSLVVWEPAWIEQQLVRLGRLPGPISGLERPELLQAAREAIPVCGLSPSTSPLAPELAWQLGQLPGEGSAEDLRGQQVDAAISRHQPRRLITLAPTLDGDRALETLVAAYCPLPDEGPMASVCGDVVVMRGGFGALEEGLQMVNPLISADLPCWVWWNGSLDEAPHLFEAVSLAPRRLVVDSAIGSPARALEVICHRAASGQAISDLNWYRLLSWRESLAMAFDMPSRRDALAHVVQLDIDVQGHQPVQGLLMAAWIADRLGWQLEHTSRAEGDGILANFRRPDGVPVRFRQMPVPVGTPSTHPGSLVGLRLVCESEGRSPLCVILCGETGGCMRLEAGGMARLELVEEVVATAVESAQKEVSRTLRGGHDSTNPLLSAAAPLAAKLLPR
jgi:glucose-6-phosphate dehydrogenase assembly protein OpcA